jgi:hypothetical protein
MNKFSYAAGTPGWNDNGMLKYSFRENGFTSLSDYRKRIFNIRDDSYYTVYAVRGPDYDYRRISDA